MLKDINWNKVMLIMIVSFMILVTSWLLYINYAIKGPLEEAVASIDGVMVNDISIEGDEVFLDITLNNVENFQDTYTEIQNQADLFLKNKNLNVNITNKSSEDIINVWNDSYFYIAEAIEQRKYSLIPPAMDSLEQSSKLDKIGYGIDDNNLYFDLHLDGSSLYIIIPRSSSRVVNEIG